MSKRNKPQAKVRSAAESRWMPWIDRHALAVCVALIALGSARIAATYTVFNHTIDEPAHIACGMEWLARGVYQLEPQHPPLARIAAALGPYLAGQRPAGTGTMYQEGAWELSSGGHYNRNLALARLGALPFFWIASLAVFFWARRVAGGAAAAIAVFLFTFLPPILAHSGLATTDMALTAFVILSFYLLLRTMEDPSALRGVALGACLACATLSKFSALPFLAVAAAAALLVWIARGRPSAIVSAARRRVPALAIAAAVMIFFVWAGYRFSFGDAAALDMRVPAPEFFQGIHDVIDHNRQGHISYLFGSYSQFGWWYYYPVVLFFKSPLPFLALAGFGVAVVARKAGAAPVYPLAFSFAILAFSMFTHVNIGVRHILPVYAGLSIAAACGTIRLVEKASAARWAKWTVAGLIVWLAAGSLASHPDYIPYFNLLAGSQPEKILVDSDLDWGQDMKRLGKRLQEVGARQVAFNPFIVGYLERDFGFPPIQPMDPQFPSPGWNAASITEVKIGMSKFRFEGVPFWTDSAIPTERLGKTTLLWYFPPQAATPK